MRIPAHLRLSRHGIYYFRIVVPKFVRPAFGGCSEIKSSLRTRNLKVAMIEARRFALAAYASFEKAKAFMSNGKRVDHKGKCITYESLAQQLAAHDGQAERDALEMQELIGTLVDRGLVANPTFNGTQLVLTLPVSPIWAQKQPPAQPAGGSTPPLMTSNMNSNCFINVSNAGAATAAPGGASAAAASPPQTPVTPTGNPSPKKTRRKTKSAPPSEVVESEDQGKPGMTVDGVIQLIEQADRFSFVQAAESQRMYRNWVADGLTFEAVSAAMNTVLADPARAKTPAEIDKEIRFGHIERERRRRRAGVAL